MCHLGVVYGAIVNPHWDAIHSQAQLFTLVYQDINVLWFSDVSSLSCITKTVK